MAFAPIYGFETNITAATTAIAGQIQIDPNVAQQLVTLLGGNYTYVALSDGLNYEIIRIDSVNPPNLIVTRGQSGTTPASFPEGACLRFVWTSQGIAAVAGASTIALTGAGALAVTQTAPNAWTLTVPTPTIAGSDPIEVLGAYPAWEIAYAASNTGCCCSGSSGGGGGSGVQTLTGLGIANASVDGSGNGTVSVSPPNFIGLGGISITGSWPTFTISYSGGGGGGGVQTITGSAKILLSGPSTTPTISLATTGVGTGTYNGVTYDIYGTITNVDLTYVPVTDIISNNPGISVLGAGGIFTMALNHATTTDIGGVILAASTAAGTNNPVDTTSAVTPAGIAALLNSGVVASTQYNGSNSSLAPSSYSNLTSATITISGTSPISVLLNAIVGVVDSSSPTVPPTFGIAIFNGATMVVGTAAMLTGQVQIQFKMPVSSPTTLTLKTTALTGTQTVEWASLSAIVTEV